MKTTTIIGLLLGFIVTAGLIYFFTPYKTAWLIARVSPYEQSVSSAPTVLVLGDSTGYGTGARTAQESVAGRLGSDYAVSIKNRSVNGRTIEGLLADTSGLTGQYKMILLQIGANDILDRRDIDTVEQELRLLVNRLNAHTENLVMISSGNVGASPRFNGSEAATYEQLSRQFRDMFMRVGKSTSLIYVDLFEEPSEDDFVSDPETFMSWDGLHPTSAGYAQWYNMLRPTIDQILQPYARATK